MKNGHFFKILQKLCITKQKCQKWPIFVDEKEIDKIRNTPEIFPFVAKFVFSWSLEIVLDLLHGRKKLKNVFGTYGFFFSVNHYIYSNIFFLFHVNGAR